MPFVDRGHHARALPDLLLLARMERRQDRPRALRVLEAQALGPGRLLPDHLGGRQHVRRRREHRAAVQVAVALGGDVAALRGYAQRAVRGLLGVRMHRLVREEQRERFRSLALEEFDR